MEGCGGYFCQKGLFDAKCRYWPVHEDGSETA
jgi:hypothetical protein